MKDRLYYDDETLAKAHHALMAEGLAPQDAEDAITALLNAGLLIRERTTEPEVGVTYLLDLDTLDETYATFAGGQPHTTVILPRERFIALHRPGTLTVEISA